MLEVLWNITKLAGLIALFGALGGVSSALVKNPSKGHDGYLLPCPIKGPGHEKKMGFIGEVIIGISASILAFFMFASFIGVQISQLFDETTELYLKLAALGVVAGFLGPTVLKSISYTFQSILAARKMKLQDEIRQLESKHLENERGQQFITLGNAYRYWANTKFDDDKYYEYAMSKADTYYTFATEYSTTHNDALMQRSFLLADRAGRLKVQGNDAKSREMYKTAIELMDTAIERDKEYGRAFYNRACYTYLAYGMTKIKSILDDLEAAANKDEVWARIASDDPDLADLRRHERFQRLAKMSDDLWK